MLKKILIALPIILIAIAGSLYYLVNRQVRVQADLLVSQALASGN